MALAPCVIQVGAALTGPLTALGTAPFVNFFVVAGQQHRRHSAALPDLRAGKLGIFQQPVPVALILIAFFLSQHAGLQAQHAVGHNKAGQLTTGQHIITDRDFLIAEGVNDALVNALIMAADEGNGVIGGQFPGLFLIVGAARSRQEHHMGLLPPLPGALGLHSPQAVGDRLCVQHHAAAAAVGVVIGLLLLVFCIVADLMAVRLEQVLRACAAQNAGREEAVAQLGKKRYDINAHRLSPHRRSQHR